MGNNIFFKNKIEEAMSLQASDFYYDCNQNTFFGYMGITAALVFGNFGAAYGTAKSGVGVCSAVVLKPELLFKSIIPIVMAGILGIYGLIVAVLFNGDIKSSTFDQMAVGVVGDAAVRANAQKDMVVGMILILIFAEA